MDGLERGERNVTLRSLERNRYPSRCGGTSASELRLGPTSEQITGIAIPRAPARSVGARRLAMASGEDAKLMHFRFSGR